MVLGLTTKDKLAYIHCLEYTHIICVVKIDDSVMPIDPNAYNVTVFVKTSHEMLYHSLGFSYPVHQLKVKQ